MEKNQLSKGRMEELKRVQETELSFISYQKDIPQEQICYLILFSKIQLNLILKFQQDITISLQLLECISD